MAILFYSHTRGDYCSFSNFYHSPFEIDGKQYATAEHYFQACKATSEEDHEEIRLAPDPYRTKSLGGKVRMRSDWSEVRFSVMKRALLAKFRQNPDLCALLLGTGDDVIHEDTSNDRIWGWAKGEGKDLLGKALMEVRAELRGEGA